MKEILSYIEGTKIVLSPWETYKNDYNIDRNDTVKRHLYEEYSKELSKIKDIIYINPNRFIKEAILHNGENIYLIDGVHPNSNEGIKLYSYSILRSKEINNIRVVEKQ